MGEVRVPLLHRWSRGEGGKGWRWQELALISTGIITPVVLAQHQGNPKNHLV